jgi:hypothetical protein
MKLILGAFAAAILGALLVTVMQGALGPASTPASQIALGPASGPSKWWLLLLVTLSLALVSASIGYLKGYRFFGWYWLSPEISPPAQNPPPSPLDITARLLSQPDTGPWGAVAKYDDHAVLVGEKAVRNALEEKPLQINSVYRTYTTGRAAMVLVVIANILVFISMMNIFNTTDFSATQVAYVGGTYGPYIDNGRILAVIGRKLYTF